MKDSSKRMEEAYQNYELWGQIKQEFKMLLHQFLDMAGELLPVLILSSIFE